jgi:hypothetical protein
MRARHGAVWAWMAAAALLSCGEATAQSRIGVIAVETPETAALAPLVELRLGKDANTVLVERNAIQEVLCEQTLRPSWLAILAGAAAG